MVTPRPDPDDFDARRDMTPMIDCVFLMIVFFVCLDFRTLEAKLPSFLPRDRGIHPNRVDPEPQLSVRVVCESYGTERPDPARSGRAILDDHRVHWQVGPRTIGSAEELRAELQRLAADPAMQVADEERPGQRRLVDCVIEPGPGAVYDDAARTADVLAAAGFTTIQWGGGAGARPR